MSEPGGDPSSGIGSGDALILPERHLACSGHLCHGWCSSGCSNNPITDGPPVACASVKRVSKRSLRWIASSAGGVEPERRCRLLRRVSRTLERRIRSWRALTTGPSKTSSSGKSIRWVGWGRPISPTWPITALASAVRRSITGSISSGWPSRTRSMRMSCRRRELCERLHQEFKRRNQNPNSTALGRDRSRVVLGGAPRWSDHDAQSRRMADADMQARRRTGSNTNKATAPCKLCK